MQFTFENCLLSSKYHQSIKKGHLEYQGGVLARVVSQYPVQEGAGGREEDPVSPQGGVLAHDGHVGEGDGVLALILTVTGLSFTYLLGGGSQD